MSDSKRSPFTRQHDSDDAIDAEIEAAFSSPPSEPGEIPLKRQWDAELEAELDAAMKDVDLKAIDIPRSGRTRAVDRSQEPGSDRGQEPQADGVRQAKVIRVRGEDVFLDLGAKSEGLIPLSQFGETPPETGATIEVLFDRYDPGEGLVLMKLKGAAVHADWSVLRQGLIVEARVVKEVKGGLQVEVDGIRGFLPISQIELGRVDDLKPYMEQKLRVMVTEANSRERNLIVSRRDLLEQERAEQREKTWAELQEGQVKKGVVRSVRDFGAFVDIGGLDGLVHVSDLSWSRVSKAQDLLRIGDEVEVKVLRIDRETQKIGLGLKQLAPSPWDRADGTYMPGRTVPGKVTRLEKFGAFVELEPGLEGLIHISELSNKRVYRVQDHVQPGQEVEVRILDVDTDAHRISLSLKPSLSTQSAPAPDALDDADDDAPTAPRPVRKVPLKGGLGDRDADPFSRPPKA